MSTEQTIQKSVVVDGSFVVLADGMDQTKMGGGTSELDENDFRI